MRRKWKEIFRLRYFVILKVYNLLPFSISVPVVKETWGNTTTHIEYYSEKEDPDIPTVDLGLPNTERGEFRDD